MTTKFTESFEYFKWLDEQEKMASKPTSKPGTKDDKNKKDR